MSADVRRALPRRGRVIAVVVGLMLVAASCAGDGPPSPAVVVEDRSLAPGSGDESFGDQSGDPAVVVTSDESAPNASPPPDTTSDPETSTTPDLETSTTAAATTTTATTTAATTPPTTTPPTTTPPTTTPPTTTLDELPSAPNEVAGPLELVFRDEFGGNTLDDVWTTCYWWQLDGGCTISSNDEQQWYRPEGVDLADGSLRLEVSEREQRTTDGDRLPYRSGMVSTGSVDDRGPSGFEFTYGIVEARVRFPEGDGLWPAVWLLSADRTSLPEIDIVEWYGSRSHQITSHVHQRIDGERSSGRIEADFEQSLAGDWHVVAADWSPEGVVFYFDGIETGRVDDPALVPDTPMYLILNLAAGGQAGDVDASALPQSMYIDYVRVWQVSDR